MAAVGLHLGPVYLVELDAGILVGVVPRALADNHLPPHATVFCGVDPACVLNLARLVEVVYHLGGEHRARVVAHHHGAPGSLAGCLHVALHACGVGCKPRFEHEVLVVEVEVHRGVVHACGLMDVDVESILGLELQGCLHAGGREHGHGRVAPVDRVVEARTYLGEPRLLRFLLLRVVVAGKPPCRVVAGHGKLGVLVLDDKIDEGVLLWKLIAQSHSLIIDTETDDHLALGCGLVEGHGQLVVAVAHLGHLPPDGFPSLVESGGLGVLDLEAIHQRGLAHALGGVLVLGELQPQSRRPHHGLVLVTHLVGGAPTVEIEPHGHIAVGRFHFLRCGQQGQKHGAKQNCYFVHVVFVLYLFLVLVEILEGYSP